MVNPVVKFGHSLLAQPICYDLFQSAVGSVNFRTEFVKKNVNQFEFESVLDLGCGTASTVGLIPQYTQYVGIDTSEEYLAKARNRSQNINTTLINTSIDDNSWVKSIELKGETLSLALGIFHHIDDLQLEGTLRNLSEGLKKGSRIVSLDPIVDEQTSLLASWFARNDRGRFIRTAEKYDSLFNEVGFRIPYDLLLMRAEKIV